MLRYYFAVLHHVNPGFIISYFRFICNSKDIVYQQSNNIDPALVRMRVTTAKSGIDFRYVIVAVNAEYVNVHYTSQTQSNDKIGKKLKQTFILDRNRLIRFTSSHLLIFSLANMATGSPDIRSI